MIFLNVPFSEKNHAKSLGARWDSAKRQWFVPEGAQIEKFALWLPAPAKAPTPAQENLPGDTSEHPDQPSRGISLVDLMAQVSMAVTRHVASPQWVRAEISQLRSINGGHVALELVEHDAQGNLTARVQSFVWAAVAGKLQRQFADATGGTLASGLKVMVQVKPDFQATHGLRLVILDIDPSYTLGDIEAKRRQIRDALSKEGVLDLNRRLPSPTEFCRVAVISPPDAAGLGDFRRDADLLELFGLCRFDYHTARFQGSGAPESILVALQFVAEAMKKGARFDALCLIRGGGSVTDLYWLNDLDLARAVCRFPIPVLTGIGHERDNTVLDEVANIRFDTPSKVIGHIRTAIHGNARAAAEHFNAITAGAAQAVARAEKNLDETLALVQSRTARCVTEADGNIERLMSGLGPSVNRRLSSAETKLDHGLDWIRGRAESSFREAAQKLDGYASQVVAGASRLIALSEKDAENLVWEVLHLAENGLDIAAHRVDALGREILGLGPSATLKRGFTLVRDESGAPVTSAGAAKRQSRLDIEFRDGAVCVRPVEY